MKKVLITGGSGGIGSAIVRLFSQNGYAVYFTYNNSHAEALSLQKETNATPIKCDLKNSESVSSLKNAIGSVDILINNAGISQFSLFTDISESDWDNMMDVNLKSAFLVTKTFLPNMISKKWGRIINVSSMWGISGASCEVHYSASKAGLIGLTKALAKEVAPSNVTVNCVAPGIIDTKMNAHLSQEDKKEFEECVPLLRSGKPEEVANAIMFLASDQASYITGVVLPVDGGYTI